MSPETSDNNVDASPPVAGVDFHHYDINGLRMRVAEQGEGPLVLFVHGWPESWYSWRHQIPAVAAAGYHAVAPDMRGYGGTTAPSAVADYDITHLCADLTGLVAELGETEAVLVGHDWGAVAGWQCALLEPDVFRAVVNMSVPYRGRSERSLIDVLQQSYGEKFFYILYFQELDENGNGIAEAEFDADPRGVLSRLYASPDTPREDPSVSDPLRSAGGWIPRLGAPTELPPWLSQEDLDYYVGEFTRAGFRGGISYYRNFHRNWETTPQLAGALVQQPSLFIAGDKDGVIAGATQEQLEEGMSAVIADLRGVHLIADTGHWLQQERPEEVNRLLLEFLASLD
jgi:pimeloyl-ACP methyl ester carboxylesterase